MTDTGNLRGILLLGITNEGLDLFARYIEHTSDVQTISLILLRALAESDMPEPEGQDVDRQLPTTARLLASVEHQSPVRHRVVQSVASPEGTETKHIRFVQLLLSSDQFVHQSVPVCGQSAGDLSATIVSPPVQPKHIDALHQQESDPELSDVSQAVAEVCALPDSVGHTRWLILATRA